jgi:hypothetical protein
MLSPIGIIVIACYSMLILLAFGLLGWLPSFLVSWVFDRPLARWVRLACWVLLTPPALVLLSLPWVEEALISRSFDEACKDAGVKVYRQVQVDGFYDATVPSGYDHIKNDGYGFMEHLRDVDGKIIRIERPVDMKTPLNQWKKVVMDYPTARYHLINAYQKGRYQIKEPIGWKLQKIEEQVVDSQTGEILGRNTTIIRVAPFHEALIASLFGPPIVMCHAPNVKPYVSQPPFLKSILKPISNQ